MLGLLDLLAPNVGQVQAQLRRIFAELRSSFVQILVTGGAGYIGGSVALRLLEQGHNVYIYDNLCHARREAVPQGAEFIEGDVADRAKVEALLRGRKIEAVLHFAALIEAGESMQRPELYFRNNTAATLGLLEAMLAAGVRKLVFSSTAAVYGEPESTPIREEAALRPTNPYGESKLLVEQMLGWLHRIHGLRTASLRYFNVAGALAGRGEAHEPESHLIPLILDVALGRRKSIKIYGTDYPTPDGTCVRDYIHVWDLAEAHLVLLENLQPGRGLFYNLGVGRGYSVREVIDACRAVTGKDIATRQVARRPGDPPALFASPEGMARDFHWKAKITDLHVIVESAWRWFQAHPNGYQ